MIVDPSAQSKQDAFDIALFIAQDNQSAALRFLDKLEETYELLADFPEIGHPPYFDFIEGLMTLQVKGFNNHSIFYRILGDVIRIERVSDMSQVLPSMFKHLEE